MIRDHQQVQNHVDKESRESTILKCLIPKKKDIVGFQKESWLCLYFFLVLIRFGTLTEYLLARIQKGTRFWQI